MRESEQTAVQDFEYGENIDQDEQNESGFKDFLDNTTLHGARYLNEKHFLRKLIWALFLIAAFSVCGFQTFKCFSAYYERPFSTVMMKKRVPELDFPAITICNLNALSKNQYVKIQRMFKDNRTDDVIVKEIEELLNIMGSLHQGGNISREDQEYLQKFFDPAYELRTKILYDALINYSHQIEGILSMQWFGPCKWQGQPCNATNFTHIIDLKMGKCYTFKSNLKSSLVGPNNGLRLRLNLEESDHVRNAYVPMSGFKVVIHDRWEYPFPDEEGFALHPVHMRTVRYGRKRSLIYRTHMRPNAIREATTSAITSTCLTPFPPASSSVYTTTGWKSAIANRFSNSKKTKNFVPSRMYLSAFIQNSMYIFYCPKRIEREGESFTAMRGQALPDKVAKCANSCPEACSYTKYDAKLSYANAVGNAFSQSLPPVTSEGAKSESYKRLLNLTVEKREKYFRENVVSLDVYYEELSYDQIEQKPAFDDWALIGNYIQGFRHRCMN
ncbi:predicted protein [Nematostella vectensis]|uniref:Uncharacterized protein n=1 Tax=Nematostella vectensis TaxID=45351 RepID=A7RLG1_NEMVE|nr:predicted protein [Nematostella vectensis]|eukprot:XP_001639747.1 predicted protein [Nematostella vectensis]